MGKLFGTDGVRGVANRELTPIMAYKIGKIIAHILSKEKGTSVKILVGMDTRISGTMLGAAFSAGACSSGANVVNLGIIPTPAVAFLVRELRCDAGVVISASHNPMHDNGIKVLDSKGFKISAEFEGKIEEFVLSDVDNLPVLTGADVGRIVEDYESVNLYIEYMAQVFKDIDLSDIKIAIDCAEGATYLAAPAILKKLNANLHVIHNEPTGMNINKGCGSTHLDAIKKVVVDNKMDIGIAFDGDGDRVLMVDGDGNEADGDQIMSFCAHYMKEQGTLTKDMLVVTVMSNMGLNIMAEENGITLERTAVGDKYVLEKMVEEGASLGGEQSGHIIFLEHNTTGDGILTALNVLNIMHKKNATLKEVNTKMKVMPQVVVGAKVSNEKKRDFDKEPIIKDAIDALDKEYEGRGRILVRASGTEPLVRIMIEGEDLEKMTKEANELKLLMEKRLGA